MKMRRHWSIYVIGALLVIGILTNVRQLIIPIVIFGVIFLLWKFPPDKWGAMLKKNTNTPSSSYPRTKSARDKRKTVPFKVIQGSKKDKDDKDQDPPYPFH